MTNNEKIKTFFARAKKFCNETLVPSCITAGAKAWRYARPWLLKGREAVVKTAGNVKEYTEKKTVQFCDYLAENEIPAAKMEPHIKAAYICQNFIEVDYTISEHLDEPVESIFQKARCLWKWLFADNFFVFRRVKRRLQKNKKVSKRDIRALEEDELLEALVLALKVDNVAFIEKAIKLRSVPNSFLKRALNSGSLELVKLIAIRYPEISTSPYVLERLAKDREFALCHKVLGYVEHLGQEYQTFTKVLIHRRDVWDYEGWQVLDFLIKEKKIKESTLRALFRKEVDASCCRNFEEWRTSRRSATFLFIYFVV